MIEVIVALAAGNAAAVEAAVGDVLEGVPPRMERMD